MINELTYFTDISNPATRTRVPGVFTIVAEPIGAIGPDVVTDHSFTNIQMLTNAVVAKNEPRASIPSDSTPPTL